MIRVLVVDDQALLRGGFRLILESQPGIEVVAEAADGREALAKARELRPDVVLMDVRMPGMDGLEATRQLLAGREPPRVLMLTTFDLDEYVYDALRAGASGFLLKDVRPEQLADAVRVVADGETLLAPAITQRLVQQYVRRARPGTTRPPGLDTLTDREVSVLRLIARGDSNAEIAAGLFLSQTTVKTHVAHVFSKLGLRDRAQAVVVAYESGLVEPGEPLP
ncbi:DNA-binding NarL/FixJ family response regulator [Kribbella steppae]|uniref:DNA-binding NarL/FixJ family response regulator n=1 Tax=Kribbella steppae TaxID=2512223 RepID=A0A4R2I127_9ACTN|nr:response regulator transcription factor [Kribbella steppae]TCO36075.1 DNA-binding NarL/FixJ family response regulator [Kribbella steppae]